MMMCSRLFNKITEGLLVGGALCFALSSPAPAQVRKDCLNHRDV